MLYPIPAAQRQLEAALDQATQPAAWCDHGTHHRLRMSCGESLLLGPDNISEWTVTLTFHAKIAAESAEGARAEAGREIRHRLEQALAELRAVEAVL